MSEIPWQNFESNENLPKLKQATAEEVDKVKDEVEYSNKLVKVNNVLNVLDFPDNVEDKFRKVLEKQDDKILIELATKPKDEVLLFLKNIKTTENQKESLNNNEKSNKIEQKLSKIKQTLTPQILSNHQDIAKNFEALNLAKTPQEKEAILQEVLKLLKDPWKLQAIIQELWWADKNNPKYQEFKNTLIWIDSSFENVFREIEQVNISEALSPNEVITDIEKDWIVDIDLKSNPPVSKLSLKDSDYSFDKNINIQELQEVMGESTDKLKSLQNSFAILKGSYEPFNGLLNQIRTNWGKENFQDKINIAISNFPQDIFSNLGELYEDMEIPSDIQLKSSDIENLKNIKSPNELKDKIENIKTKFQKIALEIQEQQTQILKEHKAEIQILLERKSEAKEKQLEVLKFFKASWFDLIPKDISNKLIAELQSNTLIIHWLELNVANIDLKNWHFGESGAFIDQDGWINTMAKMNIVKFMNKMISWNIWEPLDVTTIANGVWVVNPAKLKNDFIEAWIMGGVGWKYNTIVENLKRETTNQKT